MEWAIFIIRLVFLQNHVSSFKNINCLSPNGSYMKEIQNAKTICSIKNRETEGSHKGCALLSSTGREHKWVWPLPTLMKG